MGCEWDSETTYVAAGNGHVECLKYAHENGCPWHPRTTRAAARYGRLECLMYIYEHCGDVATWENANLEEKFDDFSKEIQDYINSVREDWKAGLNRRGMRTKAAKRN